MATFSRPSCALSLLALALVTLPAGVRAAPGDTELVSEHYAPVTTLHGLWVLDVSYDGRYVLFVSDSPAFVAGDTNGVLDLFVRDRFGGSTVRANRSTTGAAVPTFPPFTARMSADGRYVAFESDAANVVPNDTNGAGDVFLRDLQAGTTELVSRATNGQQYGFASTPAVSADGRYVAFGGPGAVYVRDRLTQVTTSRTGAFLQGSPLISGDGDTLVYRNYDRVVRL